MNDLPISIRRLMKTLRHRHYFMCFLFWIWEINFRSLYTAKKASTFYLDLFLLHFGNNIRFLRNVCTAVAPSIDNILACCVPCTRAKQQPN